MDRNVLHGGGGLSTSHGGLVIVILISTGGPVLVFGPVSTWWRSKDLSAHHGYGYIAALLLMSTPRQTTFHGDLRQISGSGTTLTQ